MAGRSTRTRLTALALAVTTATALVVATAGAAPAATKVKPGGTITYGLESETGGGWCPRTARLAISGIEVAAAIYDTLTAPNTKGQIKPYLAKSVTPNTDYTQWTITLRNGITFHDGTPVDAAAVAANIDAYRDNLLVGQGLKNIASVTVANSTTINVATVTAWPQFPWFLYLDGRMAIVAPKQLNGSNADCASNLVGSGPFKLAEPWVVNTKLVTTKNATYWQKDANGTALPYLDGITFVPVPEANQRVNGVQGRTFDVIHTSDGLQVDALNQLKGTLNLMQEKAGRREVRNYLMNAVKAPLDDLNARKAVAMAIDRNQVNELRNAGVFDVANGPFDSQVMGYLKNPGFPKYNPTEARKLVDAYTAAHGVWFSVVLEHTNDPANAEEAALLKQQLAKVGIDATLTPDDQTSFITAAVGGNYSILLWRNYPG
ncbi:MAG: ABC transporter substrate-binding protein, partial [Acidimicrobiia bacterium]